MPKKIKCPSCSTGWCANHILELQPIKSYDCYYRKKMKLRLCPKLNNTTNAFQRSMPIINNDRKFYTPCFILEDQKTYYNENDDKLLNTHKLKLQSQSNENIWVPKHGRKKNYCSVCKSQYEDYMTHVEQLGHRQYLRNNKFSKYIVQTEEQLKMLSLSKQIKEVEPVLESKIDYQTNQPEKVVKHTTLPQN